MIIAACFGSTLAARAQTIILDFEDLSPTGGFFQPMPSGYGGINWADNFWPYDEAQDPFNPNSGIVRIASNRVPRPDDPIPRGQFQFAIPDQVFNGAWFAGPSPPQVVEVYFELYNDTVLVHTSATLQMSPVPTFLASGYSEPVDAVTIVGPEGEFVFDDLAYTRLSPDVIDVDIDIKPGDKRNNISPKSMGLILVAILGSQDFDTLQVEPRTVRFGPGGAKAVGSRTQVLDVNNDSYPDLVLRFEIRKTGIQCGDTEAELIGDTHSGESFVGTDFITTVGCN